MAPKPLQVNQIYIDMECSLTFTHEDFVCPGWSPFLLDEARTARLTLVTTGVVLTSAHQQIGVV